MSAENPAISPTPRKPSSRLPLVIALGVAGLAGLSFAAALLRQEARRQSMFTQCLNNVRHLGLAFLERERGGQRSFPPQFSGNPPRSWRVEILPWLEQATLFQLYDPTRAWNEGANLPLGQNRVPQYLCSAVMQSQPAGQPVYAAYFLPVGKDAAFEGERAPRLTDFNDGLSNTAIFVESCNQKIVWTEPRDISIDDAAMRVDTLNANPAIPGAILASPHREGAVVGMADGSVRAIRPDVDPKFLRSLLLPRDVANKQPVNF